METGGAGVGAVPKVVEVSGWLVALFFKFEKEELQKSKQRQQWGTIEN